MPPPWWKNKYKPPALFSATEEFIGFIVGDANSPYSIVVWNQGYRYAINLATGYLEPKLSKPYTYGTFMDLYDFQYRGNDLVCGFNDPIIGPSSIPVTWNYVRTTATNPVPGTIITHSKEWNGSGWNYVALSSEVRAYISQFQFHRWVQVTSIPFSIPVVLPCTIAVDY